MPHPTRTHPGNAMPLLKAGGRPCISPAAARQAGSAEVVAAQVKLMSRKRRAGPVSQLWVRFRLHDRGFKADAGIGQGAADGGGTARGDRATCANDHLPGAVEGDTAQRRGSSRVARGPGLRSC